MDSRGQAGNRWYIYTAGIPGAGKSAFAGEFKRLLEEAGIRTVVHNWDTWWAYIYLQKLRKDGETEKIEQFKNDPKLFWESLGNWRFVEVSKRKKKEIDDWISDKVKDAIRSDAPVVVLDTVGYLYGLRKKYITEAKKTGRQVMAVIFGVQPEEALRRIENRVKEGGNPVEEKSIRFFYNRFVPLFLSEFDYLACVGGNGVPAESAKAAGDIILHNKECVFTENVAVVPRRVMLRYFGSSFRVDIDSVDDIVEAVRNNISVEGAALSEGLSREPALSEDSISEDSIDIEEFDL